jgi:restriction endonuclease
VAYISPMSLRNFLDRALKPGTSESKHVDTPRFGTGGDDHDLLPRLRMEREVQRQAEELAAECKRQADAVLTKNSDLVDKFLEIAERKVSVLDDYGDENWGILSEQIDKCLSKIGKREQSVDVTRISQKSQVPPSAMRFLPGYDESLVRNLAEGLESRFRAHHEARKKFSAAAQDISMLSGVDFEVYVAKLLKEVGYDVVGTPASGDQGADLIARRNGRTIAIQAKRYSGTVGNGAVQEIVGALRFYGADEGLVVTTSTFTASARALAHANSVRLIDGHDLKDPAALKAKL